MYNIYSVLKALSIFWNTFFYFVQVLFKNFTDKNDQIPSLRTKWAKKISFLIGMKTRIEGTPPRAPFFLVSNHLSYIDIFLLLSFVHGTFIAKSEINQWPILGFILRNSGIIFINRKEKKDTVNVNEKLMKKVNHSQGVIIFPEGFISDGSEVKKFKSSLFEIPAKQKIPLYTASITYGIDTKENTRKLICWADDTPFLIHLLRLLRLKQFKAKIVFDTIQMPTTSRKELAQEAENVVRKNFIPI